MKGRLLRTLIALLTVSVALAGCAGDDEAAGTDSAIEGKVDEGEFQLETGKGAIAGLLVDDRFRPIDLADDPQTEFQFTGFILLQETGEQVKTNENGEFSFVDLEPGEYTLRATIDRHEASPAKITVEEGLFAEATMLARRVSSEGSTILTEEYTGFAPCIVPVLISNCLDASAESYRPGPEGLNYTGFDDELTYVVVEVQTSQPEQDLMVQCRSGVVHAEILLPVDEAYGKVILLNDGNESYAGEFNEAPWDNPEDWECILFLNDFVVNMALDQEPEGQFTPAFGIKTQFIISLFLGEPEVDLETYRLLYEDSS